MDRPDKPERPGPIAITQEQFDALNAAVEEAGVRFVGADGNDLVFEVQRRAEHRVVPLSDIAEMVQELLSDTEEPAARAVLDQGAQVQLVFY
jgi:hypothetical protein